MAKFTRGSTEETKFSDISDHFTKYVVAGQPVENKISDFYKGGRYIAERRDQINVYPDTAVKDLKIHNYEYSFFMIRTNGEPKVDDRIETFYSNGNKAGNGLHVANVMHYSHPVIQADIATTGLPAWSGLDAAGKNYYGQVYWIAVSNLGTTASNDIKDHYWKLNAGDAAGDANLNPSLRFTRAKTKIIRNTQNVYVKAKRGSDPTLNPSTNIPVEVVGKESGTEIKFSDFHNGYANIKQSSRNTTWETQRLTANLYNVEFTTTWTTANHHNTSYTTIIEKNSTKYWQQPYRVPVQQSYRQSYQQPNEYKKQQSYTAQFGRQQSQGIGFYSWTVDVEPTYARKQIDTTYYSTQRKTAYRSAQGSRSKQLSSTKYWDVECTRSKLTSGETSYQTDRDTSGITRYDTSRTTSVTFWD
jgi:hypothetical protein